MRTAFAAFAVTARGLLGTGAWIWFGAVLVILFGLGLLQYDLTAQHAWMTRSTLLAIFLWLPGLWVALKLRDAWPALGPGDEALAWVTWLGYRPIPLRAGAIGGACAALIILQLAAGIAVGLCSLAHGGRPTFRETAELKNVGDGAILARPQQHESFLLPALPSGGVLRLEPRYYFSMLRIRAPVELEIRGRLDERQFESVARARLHDFGAATEVDIPPRPAGELRIVRTGGEGSPVSFSGGRVIVLSDSVPIVAACVRLSLGHLSWAFTLLAVAIATAQLLNSGVQILALVGIAPLLGLLPHLTQTPIATRLARGELPAASMPSLPLLLTIGLAVTIGLVPVHRAVHQPK